MDEKKLITQIAYDIQSIGGILFYVGGCVRDELLNRPFKDYDIEVYQITVEQLFSVLSKYGTVIEIGKSFGVLSLKGYPFDFALARMENRIGNKHQDFEVTVDPYLSYYDASKRRDITINALMKNVLTGEIIDEHNGLDDLKNKVIRHIDEKTFIEDALRVFRVAQFSARLEFDVAESTIKLCRSMDVTALSKERVYEETNKALLSADKPSLYFKCLKQMNHVSYWFKELYQLIDLPHMFENHPEKDVWEHTMMALDVAASLKDKASNALFYMYAVLCHDLGKSITTRLVDGSYRSYDHDRFGGDVARDLLKRITDNKQLIVYVKDMVKLHHQPRYCIKFDWDDYKTRRLFHQSVNPKDLVLVSQADLIGRGKVPENTEHMISILNEKIEEFKTYMNQYDVNGNDYLKMGFDGSIMKEMLEASLDLYFRGRSKEEILSEIKARYKEYL